MNPDLRIGLGIDRHRFVAGRPLILGGHRIPHDKGLLGHSDGDAILHAAVDAVLGAAGDDDIGTLFSDRDPANANADSTRFAAVARERVAARGFKILSLDAVVVADEPKIAPHRAAIRAALARAFGLAPDRVNVKGKTREGAGPDDLLEATVVALLARDA